MTIGCFPVEKSIIDDEHSTRFENLIYRALSSGLITESKAAVLLNIGMLTIQTADDRIFLPENPKAHW